MKARSNNLQLKYRPFRLIKVKSTKCRHCGYGAESQAHVLNHCTASGATIKHNATLNILGEFLRGLGLDVDIDASPVEIATNARPDLIIRNMKTNQTHLLDLKVPYDEIALFDQHRALNMRKYSDLTLDLCRVKRQKVTLGTITVGCLGSWDPENDSDLKRIGLTGRDIGELSQILLRSVVRQSYHLYLEHVSANPKIPSTT